MAFLDSNGMVLNHHSIEFDVYLVLVRKIIIDLKSVIGMRNRSSISSNQPRIIRELVTPNRIARQEN